MIQAATILTSLKRVARVSVIAVFTASTLALLGATGEGRTTARKITHQAASKQLVSLTTVKSTATAAPVAATWGELLVDDSTAATVVSSVPASHTMRMEVTAYCPCVKCCGPKAQGVTASGKLITHNGGK